MQRKLFFVSLIVLASMLIFSGTVFADDELPAQETPAEEAGVPAETEEPAAEAPPEMAQELVVLSGEEEAPLAEDPSSPVQDATELSAAEEVAEPTPEVFLVDTDGNALDMATQPAGDPYWVSGGTYYSSVSNVALCYPGTSVGTGTCFISTTPIQNAINLIADNSVGAPDDGFLYVEYGTYPDLVTIDGGLAGGYLNNLLGLKGIANGSGIYPVLTKSITLMNLINGFTLDGFTINGGVIVKDSSGQFVFDKVTAKVSMTDVDASNTAGAGIVFNNSKGDIILTRVTANNNNTGGSIGIIIWPHAGHVFFDTVTANDNGSNGAAIFNDTGKYNITIKNSEFNHNGLNEVISGSLSIWSNGLVTLNGVIADDSNENYGGSGIRVRSGGATLRNVITNNNAGSGIYVQLRSGSLLLENAFAGNNSADGIRVELRDSSYNELFYPANITMKYVFADNNGGDGIWVKTPGAVTLTSVQTKSNTLKGTSIISSGKVTISTIVSSYNGAEGLQIEGIPVEYVDEFFVSHILGYNCPSSITLTSAKSAAMANNFADNGSFGLAIFTNKAVTLNNFSAYSNDDHGVYVDGFEYEYWNTELEFWDTAYQKPGAIKIGTTIPNFRNTVAWNEMFGLAVYSGSTVVLENTNAFYNQYHGMDVQALNTITVKNVKANDNFGGGAIFYNADALTPKSITLTNVEFNRNMTDWGGSGVDIHSRGAVTIMNMTASGNGSSGASIQNEVSGLGRGNITLTNVTLNENGYLGLEAYSNGTIALRNVEASHNGDYGLKVKNDYQGFIAGISLIDVTANENQNSGINVTTNGNLTVASATANGNALTQGYAWVYGTVQDYYNGNFGADRWYFDAEELTPYTFVLKADGNGASGLLNRWEMDPLLALFDQDGTEITSGVSITHVSDDYYQLDWTPGSGEGGSYYLQASASADGFYRLSINDPVPDPDNSTAYYFVNGLGYTVGGNVSVSGSNTFNENSLAGMIGWSNKVVTVSNVEASHNGAEGVYIDNQNGSGNVTLSGENAVLNNGWEGLRIDTNGAVSVTKVDSYHNGLDGMRILANTAGKTVMLKNIYLLFNGENGLTLESNGVITLNNVNALYNLEDGAYVDTHAYNLNVLNSLFMRNYQDGMAVEGYLSPFTVARSTSIFFANSGMDYKVLH